jgi:MoxR-like ATPase
MNSIAELGTRLATLRAQLDRVVIGQEAVKDQVVTCLLAGGHALLEGLPGTGKTLLVLAMARLVGCRFRRIQFTPDLMPADLLGSNVFDQRTHDFVFREGPIFTDILLADEINRTPPRTQSALLEAMQEQSVTTDGVTREVSPVFTVFATQNPVELEGTYPLPEAQRDRFLLKVVIDMPSEAEEANIIEAYASGRRLHDEVVGSLTPVLTLDELAAARRLVASIVRVEADLLRYVVRLVRLTRQDPAVQLGAGPRASLALLSGSRALAALRGRDFVIPDDVKSLAAAALVHRVILTPEAEMEGVVLDDVLRRLFEQVEVPR